MISGEISADAAAAGDSSTHPTIVFVPRQPPVSTEVPAEALTMPAAVVVRPEPVPTPAPAKALPKSVEDALGSIVSALNETLPRRTPHKVAVLPLSAAAPPKRAKITQVLPPPSLAPTRLPSQGADLAALSEALPANAVAPAARKKMPAFSSLAPVQRVPSPATLLPDAPALGPVQMASNGSVVAPSLPVVKNAPAGTPAPGQAATGVDTKPADPKSVRIVRPRTGRFSTVTTASASSVAFPGTEGLLRGKVVNTAYVNVGLKKNWILQYVVMAPEDGGPVGGDVPVDAPWPWVIERPEEVTFGGNDYVIVHGFIRSSGRIEQIAMQQADSFSGSEFLMRLLGQWEFRPATRAGSPATIEILLIIPSIQPN